MRYGCLMAFLVATVTCLRASRVHKCPVTCGSKLNPVCGSDGYTYQNRCLLTARNCQRSPTEEEVTEVHAGRCDDEEFVLEDEVDDGKYKCLRIGRGRYLMC